MKLNRRRQEARTWIRQFLVQIGRRGPLEGDWLGGYGPDNVVRHTVLCRRLHHLCCALLRVSVLSLSGRPIARFLCSGKTLISRGTYAYAGVVRAIKGCELRRLEGLSSPVVSPLERYAHTQDQPNDCSLPERVCRPRMSLP